LGNCLDLLDPENVRWLKSVHDDMIEKSRRAGIPVPKNVRDKRNLDCAILNWVYSLSDDTAMPVETCRGVYVPTDKAKRVWRGSWIYEEAHIQVCVRSQENILALWHVRPDGRYGKIKRMRKRIRWSGGISPVGSPTLAGSAGTMRAISEKAKAMTPDEFRMSLVAARIITHQGKLTAEYETPRKK
jgi:hypothetical protein